MYAHRNVHQSFTLLPKIYILPCQLTSSLHKNVYMPDPPIYVKPMGYQMHCLDVYGEKLFEQIRKNYCLGIEESVSIFHVFFIYLTMLSL